MIYVKRDSAIIPDKIIKVAERAQQRLETLSAEDRPAFIKKKSHIWRSFSRHLSKMSHGKCWYSESKDHQSFFDVDHFRPKLEARRSEQIVDDEGYQWLAFDWGNYRLSSQRSNRVSNDEDTEETVGKGSWFPLLEGSPKASWNDRCIDDEKPVLLDPVKKEEVDLINVGDDGRIVPAPFCVGSAIDRVKQTALFYGLDLPKIKGARLAVMRNVTELYEILMETVVALKDAGAVADNVPIHKQIEYLKSKTKPDAPFSQAARDQLTRFPFGSNFIAKPEEFA